MKKVKEKTIGFLIALKHFLLIGGSLLAVGALWRMNGIDRKADHLALVTVKILDLRCKTIKEQMGLSAQMVSSRADGETRGIARVLTGMLESNPYIQEAAWVGGKKGEVLLFERSRGGALAKSANGFLFTADEFYKQSHEMGRVAISPLEYDRGQIPVFAVSYPLDGREGGSLLAKINLWDFLKSPTETIQELLGEHFDMEIKDRRGKLLAHKTSPENLKTFWGRFFSAQAHSQVLGFDVNVTPNRSAFGEALRPGRYFWGSLVLTVVLVALL